MAWLRFIQTSFYHRYAYQTTHYLHKEYLQNCSTYCEATETSEVFQKYMDAPKNTAIFTAELARAHETW